MHTPAGTTVKPRYFAVKNLLTHSPKSAVGLKLKVKAVISS